MSKDSFSCKDQRVWYNLTDIFSIMKYHLSIIIPIYNESKTVLEILEKVSGHPALQHIKKQILVVDDGSQDGTTEKLRQSTFFNHPDFQFFFHEKNTGKASAIRRAIPHLKGEYTIIQDGDLEYQVEDVAKLLSVAQEKNLPVVYGSRNLNTENKRGGFFFFWGGKLLTYLTNILYFQRLTDMPTCYKLIKTDLLQSLPLRSKRFEFCPEVTARIARQGIKISEIPIHYSPRSKSEGKKIKWRDGIEAVWTLVSMRFFMNKKTFLVLAVFAFASLLYVCTWNARFAGYEQETAEAAIGLLDGEYKMKRAGIGAAVLYMPFLFLQKLFSLEAIPFLTIVPIVYSALTIVFLFLMVQKLTKQIHKALFVSVLIAVGTSVWPYTVMGMEYQVMFYISVLLYLLVRWQERVENVFLPGLMFGVICITKSYGVLLGLPYVLFLLLTLQSEHKLHLAYRPSFWLKAVLPSIVLFGSTLLMNLHLYDSLSGVYSLAHEFQMKNWWEGFYGTFFSIGKSIFLYNPLLILALFFWKKFYLEYKPTAVFIIAAFVILLFITAPFVYWSDETWTVRKLVPILPLLHLPLIFYFQNIKEKFKKVVLVFTLAVSVYIQFLGAAYNYSPQLDFLYQAKMDSLTTMRYIPQYSHIYLYHKFFTSYLHKHLSLERTEFTYKDMTWFRWFRGGEHDIALHDVSLSFEPFEQPHIVWLVRGTPLKKGIFFTSSAATVIFAVYIFSQYKKYCRKESHEV